MISYIFIFFLTQQISAQEEKFTIHGWSEVVISADNINHVSEAYIKVGSWKIMNQRRLNRDWNKFYLLETKKQSREALIGNPGDSTGFIRIIVFNDPNKIDMRVNYLPWDAGGIFDFNVRTNNIERDLDKVRKLGWHGYSDPVRFQFGPYDVSEWIIVEPMSGAAMALIERHKPELLGWDTMKNWSRTFNATQIVNDMDKSLYFYQEILGFKTYLTSRAASSKEKPNVLGLPLSLTDEVSRWVEILHPEGTNSGSVELLQFEGMKGIDLSSRMKAPNRGILSLRFPVENLQNLYDHLIKNKVPVDGDMFILNLPPYGKVRIFAAYAPEGARLEFYETMD